MFDDFEGRLYHECLLNHQRASTFEHVKCMCGWVQSFGVDTYAMHLAAMVNNWVEANYTLYDKI